MHGDPILEEIWRIKDEQAALYDYDVRKLAEALKEEEKRSGRKVVTLEPRRLPTGDRPSRAEP